jgi:mannose-1-phosphate guanylyltransferase
MTGVRALLLCAGKGTRLLPLTDVLPKCLMPINGHPLLAYWLQMLCDAGTQKILVNLHHHAELVRSFVDGSPLSARVSTVYEPTLLGTAGTLLANRDFFGDSTILLAHGDNLTAFDVAGMLDAHRARPAGCEITMMTFVAQDPRSCGIVETSPNGVVTAFHEKVAKPPGNIANGAVYLIEPAVLDFLESIGRQTIDFSTEVIPAYLSRIFAYHNATYHRDIGTLESLLMAQFDYALGGGRRGGTTAPGGDGPEGFFVQNKERSARFVQVLGRALTKDIDAIP